MPRYSFRTLGSYAQNARRAMHLALHRECRPRPYVEGTEAMGPMKTR
jgi:hypothetical protein